MGEVLAGALPNKPLWPTSGGRADCECGSVAEGRSRQSGMSFGRYEMCSMDNKMIVRRFYEEIVNTGDVSRIAEVVSDDYTEVMDGNRYRVGPEGAASHVVGVRTTYPDLHLTVERQISEGEWVATCITARGTHKGDWIGIAPTDREVAFTGVNVDRVVDGKIVEHGGAANLLGPLLAIGAIRVVGRD